MVAKGEGSLKAVKTCQSPGKKRIVPVRCTKYYALRFQNSQSLAQNGDQQEIMEPLWRAVLF